MKPDPTPSDALAQEQALLAHFRAQTTGEPSAQLDARILAASAALHGGERKPGSRSWSERLHGWLFGSGRPRWSVAVAGLACLGVGVSLTWRTLEQSPERFDSVAPTALVAPAPRSARPEQMEAMPAQEYSRAARQSAAQPQETAPVLRKQAPPQAAMRVAPAAQAGALADLVDKTEPRGSLLRLLALRATGDQEQAAELLERLRLDYPQLDIEKELAVLAQEAQR